MGDIFRRFLLEYAEYHRDERNCLIPAASAGAVSDALSRVLSDPILRRRLGEAAVETASDYAWPRRIDALEQFLTDIAAPRSISPSTDVVPEPRRAEMS